jgi:hypothetical protein
MESSMQRAVFQTIASPEDRNEYRRWARRVAVVYGVLVAGGLSFAILHHSGSGSGATTATAAPPVAAVVAAAVPRAGINK